MKTGRAGRPGARSLLLLAVVLALAACGGSSSKTTGPNAPTSFNFGSNDPRRATAFGDSITVGVLDLRVRGNLTTSSNYPAVLQGMLQGLDPAWRVVNRGVGGERTAGGFRRFSSVLAADHPGFVLIMEGTNDASEEDDPAFIAANLDAMVGQAQDNHTIPILGTIPPNFRNDPQARAIIDEANVLIRNIAQARGIVLAEIFNGMNDRTLFGIAPDRDPIHPNERGYGVMAGIWFGAMRQAIPPSAAPPPMAQKQRRARR